jgi:formylglycine-generating enzyme required for sulfatase activity
MVRIPAATFQMGSAEAEIQRLRALFPRLPNEVLDAERPQHPVTLSAFRMDRTEVTRRAFQECLRQQPQWTRERLGGALRNENYLRDWRGTVAPAGTERVPVVDITWHAAAAFCAWRGARLPSEAEWEFAARGGLAMPVYPWGDMPPDASRANYAVSGIRHAVAVGSYPPNGYGLFDMAGNVWEFTADEWAPYAATPAAPFPDRASRTVAAPGAGSDAIMAVTSRRVIRGGSWAGAPLNLRVSYRDSHPPLNATDFVGFRCADSN